MSLAKYRTDIDGLRAIAVLAVFIGHLNYKWLPGGFVGVDIFFVISGFLITSIILAQRDNFNIAEFYNRRIKRILPVFYFVGFMTLGLSFCLFIPEIFTEAFKSFKTATYFLQNTFFAHATTNYFDTGVYTKPYLHTWSLAVEEQFYLIFPFLLILLRKLKVSYNTTLITLILLAFTSFAFSYVSFISPKIARLNYYFLFTSRAGELLIGCIGAFLYTRYGSLGTGNRQQATAVLAFLTLIASFFLLNEKIFYPSFVALIPTMATILVIYFANHNFGITKFLANPILSFIGKISYSLYLWHWVVIVFVKEYWGIEEFSVLQAIEVFITAFILSVCTYYGIEQVFRHKKYSFRKSFILFYLIPASIVLGTYYSNKKLDFLNFGPQHQTEEFKQMDSTFKIKDGSCSIANPCVFGDGSKLAKILLIGDSHAKHLVPFLEQIGKQYQISVSVLASASCPLTLNYMVHREPSRSFYEDCKKIVDEISNPNNLKSFNYIFISGHYTSYYSPEYLAELAKLIQSFKQAGKQVVILADIPDIEEKKIKQYKIQYLKNKTLNTDSFITPNLYMHYVKINTQMAKFAQQQGALFIDLFTPIIKSNQNDIKWPLKNNYLLYKDGNHLNNLSYKLLQTEFREQVEKSPLAKIIKSINNTPTGDK